MSTGNVDRDYWTGARDMALLVLDEMYRMDAPLPLRKRCLMLFLAVSHLGRAELGESLEAFIRLSLVASPREIPRRGRRDRRTASRAL